MYKTRIEWTNFTWKVTEGCMHGCPYCYVKRFRADMIPKFYPERLKEPLRLKKPSKIFVANTGDLFGDWQKKEDIQSVIDIVQQCPQHTFQFLTKNPKGMVGFKFPKNAWCGVSIEIEDKLWKSNILIDYVDCHIRYISFEPLLGFIDKPIPNRIGWVIVGGESVGNASTPRHERLTKEWAKALIEQATVRGIPLFLKPNLRWHEVIEQYPK